MSLASVKQEGRTLTIMNNNPSKRGALSLELYAAINEALERAQDPEIRAVIFASMGGFFCSGGDLNALQTRAGSTLEERREKIQDLHDITAGIRACPVPVIAAVEGGAAGAGLSLALACDMIVAAPRSVTAERLSDLGVINLISEDPLKEAHSLADAFAKGPRKAQGIIKGLVGQAYETREVEQLEAEREAMIRAVADTEAKIGIAAFLEKKTPEYP